MSATITCPICKQEHALFWKMPAAGLPMLKYRCNRIPVMRKSGKKEGQTMLSSAERMIGLKGKAETKPYMNLEIPEVWTKKKTRQTHAKQQQVLPF